MESLVRISAIAMFSAFAIPFFALLIVILYGWINAS